MSENEKEAPKRALPDDFGRTVSKIAVAQVLEGVGFDFVKQSALDALTCVAVRYISDLGKSANSYASLAGRTECNAVDVIKGLEDLGSSCGFSGGSEVNQCVARSGVIKEMSQFVGAVEDIPFSQPIPRFPVIKTARQIPSFSEMGESPDSKNLPEWLPAFPDPHTYMHSPVWNERKTDIRIDKGEQARQRRKAERSLLNLQQRLLFNGLAGPSSLDNYQTDDERGARGAIMEDNPYLAPALPAGEKDVAMVAMPSKLANQGDRKTRSVRETFAPVIDALNGGALDPMDVDRKVVSQRRPVVHFKLKAGKKMLVEDLDIHLKNMGKNKRGCWFPRDDDKDDKKRRVELILRQSMEYNQEHSQM
ncbi:transcription initiation factor TFIID subunit 8-like [Silene latifolia]|uniref:transcription initiation factor TFIID subunit 8-like n=1 Tax=Silene latifolia TaxID=37657 RepID=UPI003D7762FE